MRAGNHLRSAGLLAVTTALALGACGAEPESSHSGARVTQPPPSTTLGPPATSTTTRIPPVSSTSTTTTTTLPVVSLAPGDEGPEVQALQRLLAAHGFFRAEADGVFGPRTAQAVIAFHKATDTERSATWDPTDWQALSDFRVELPARPDEPDRLEIDLGRQLLYRVVNGQAADIIPVSSGNGEMYENATGKLVRARTPRGDFSLYKHYSGWRISYLGGLYRPWYFRGGYAIHGSESVPAYPASHGCVRVPLWEADHLYDHLELGWPVHVWD